MRSLDHRNAKVSLAATMGMAARVRASTTLKSPPYCYVGHEGFADRLSILIQEQPNNAPSQIRSSAAGLLQHFFTTNNNRYRREHGSLSWYKKVFQVMQMV